MEISVTMTKVSFVAASLSRRQFQETWENQSNSGNTGSIRHSLKDTKSSKQVCLILCKFQYLAKQAAALRDMNDSRLKVYEQLEVSMVELEHTNKRLGEEGLGDKERIRDLGDTVRSLEIKCEELQRLLDEVILRARPGPGDTGHSLRPDVTCQVRPERNIKI